MATGLILSQNMDSMEIESERIDAGMQIFSTKQESPAPNDLNDSEEEDDIQFHKKKRVIASDSEDETSEKMNTVDLNDKRDGSDSETDEESKPLNKSKSRIILNDDDDSSVTSESENKTGHDDNEVPSNVKTSKRKNANKSTVASDNEDDDLPSIGSTRSRDADKSDAEVPASYVDVFKNSDVFAAESSSDEERKPYDNNGKVKNDSDSDKSIKKSKNSKPRKPRKAKPVSKKQREKELAEITSRTQKMLRESNVSLPYHRPRQLTLDEFLKKRNAKVPILNSIIKSSGLKSLGGKIVLPEITNVQSIEAELEESEEVISPTKETPLPKVNEDTSRCDLQDIPNPIDPVQQWLETVTPDNVNDLKDGFDVELQDPSSGVGDSLKQKELFIDTVKGDDIQKNKEVASKKQKVKTLTEVEIKETTEEEIEITLDVKTDDKKMEVEKEVTNCKETSGNIRDKANEEVIMETDKNEVQVKDEVKNSTPNGIPNPDCSTENKNASLDSIEADNYAAQQADLDSYLESMKPKPKKLSIAERLKQMPGFSKLRPKIGKNNDSAKGIIDFNSNNNKVDSRHKNIQTLMDRFVHHTNVVKPSKEQHFKIHVVKKEEDSQGMEHVTVDEVDYIKRANSDEEEEKMGSPTQIPGSRMVRVQERLKQKIYAQKAKEFQEKLRLHAMYAEEKELEDKNTDYDPLPENEEEIDEMSESEIDEDEEEELEELLSGTPKDKRRKQNAFVDDEAEDSDDDGDADNEDQDDSDDEDEDDENNDENECNDANSKTEGEDFVDGDFDHDFPISDTLPSAQPQIEKKSLTEAASNSSVKISLQRLDMTSHNERTTPSDLWLRPAPRCPLRETMNAELEKGNETSDSAVNQLSELEEEASQESSLPASECKSPIPLTVADLVAVVGDSNGQNTEDILTVCSGTFPSQQPATPDESQNCFGFDDDDDLLLGTLDETGNQLIVETPNVMENKSNSVLNNDTPKMVERVSTTKRLFFSQNPEEATETPKLTDKVSKTRLFSSDSAYDGLENYDSDDNESVVGTRVVRKRKRLEFSDEEEEENIPEGEEENSHEEEEEEHEENEKIVGDDEEMAMEMEARTVKPKKSLFGKNGQLKKQFIDAEAELSGSEAGSEDEDERGMDRMEIEEGDEEIIDEDEVREKVGRAHLKALLDQDDEEIQHIQNELLHDGDLHMDAGRERNFKWNYMEYDLNDDGANMGDMGDDIPIDEEEVKRQIEKAEKSKWIKENSQLFEDSQQESQKSLLENTTFLRLGKASLKKFTSFSESSSFQGCDVGDTSIAFTSFSRLLTGQVKNSLANNTEKKAEETPLCKATSQPLFASPDEPITKLRRGSFLSRGAPTLSRLAEMTKISDSVSNVKSNSKNFVFTVVTPPTAEEESKSKKALRRNQSLTSNPKKMLKIDRSFSSLDDSSKEASIFKWM